MALLDVERLSKHFPVNRGLIFSREAGTVKAVDDVSFSVERGETLALVGESGCGKSTTGRLVLRLIDPSAGTIRFEGRDIAGLDKKALRALRGEMQVIFQDPYASLHPRMTVGDILAEPMRLHGVKGKVEELLGLVGLAPWHARRYPHEFSGGQRQRIGIARALAVRPKLIVCDEPVSALDVSIQAQIVNLLKDLQHRFGLSYIFIAHDLAVVRHVADRVAVMYLGKIVELAGKHAIFSRPRHPYTQALLAAIPVPDPRRPRSRALLGGEVPSPMNPPAGCRFHTRCPHAQERCRIEEPALRPLDGGHFAACHFAETLPASAAIDAAPPPYARKLALWRDAVAEKTVPAEARSVRDDARQLINSR